MKIEKVKISEKFAGISDYWSPAIIGELNGQEVRIAKVRGEFTWHSHENEDEFFLVLEGRLLIDIPGRSIELNPGEMVIIPRKTNHRPRTENNESAKILLFEPKSTVNTGGFENEFTKKDLPRL